MFNKKWKRLDRNKHVFCIPFCGSNIGLNYDKVQGDVAASETVLGIFGFDRTLYGKTKRQENGECNYELQII